MANIGGNFVNPAYASPQQIAALREYAKQLLTEQPVQHWAQGLGNVARALVGGYEARKADTEEQAANKEFAKQLMEATASKDPAKLMEAMTNPRAEPLQALLAGKLLEWGPGKRVTLPGLGLETPTEPWFNQGPMAPPQRFTPPAATPPVVPPAAAPPTATPPTAPPTAPLPGEMSSGESVIPGSRTTTGSPDSAFDVIGKQFGFQNLGALNKAGIEQAAELKRKETEAALRAGQDVTIAGQKPMVASSVQRLLPLISKVLGKVKGEGVWPPLTGTGGFVSAKYPTSKAALNAGDVEDIKNILADLHYNQITAINPNRRVFPQDYEDYKQSLGLDIRDRDKLMRNLENLHRQFVGGPESSTPAIPQGGQGPFPAQAEESPSESGKFGKVLKVIPYGGQ